MAIAVEPTFSPNIVVWVRKNGGPWNGVASAFPDPFTGSGGLSFTVNKGRFNFAVECRVSDAFTASFGLVFAEPPTQFNSGNLGANVSLSNNGLTVTRTSGLSNQTSARTLFGSTATKKFYCEIFVNNISVAAIPGAGICNAAQATTDSLAASLNGCGIFQDGNFWLNSTPTAAITGGFASGDLLSMAIDFAANLIWFRKNGGQWNASGTANPATGAGGFSIASLNAGPYFVAIEARTAADQFTANFGQPFGKVY